MNTRPPAVAGKFYEQSPSLLQSQIESWLAESPTREISQHQAIKALIVPHAGYIYSGHTAATAYRHLLPQAEKIKRVVLIGPSHYFGFYGCALPQADMFSTPLGEIPIDREQVGILAENDPVIVSDEIHGPEHSLEVQLPFLQLCLKEFRLLPILTGDVSAEVIAKIIKPFLDMEDTLLVVSSDLSHFHPDDEARKIDKESCDLIESYQAVLTPQQACGRTGINALLLLAEQYGYTLQKMEQTNSGDSIGDKDRVVGYVSYLMSIPE